jgi:hypothetical protein
MGNIVSRTWSRAAIAISLVIAASCCQSSVEAGSPRIRATQAVTFYVNPVSCRDISRINCGDDANNCTSSMTPCLTMAGAYTRAQQDYDFAGHSCTIQLADGRHTSPANIAGSLVGTHLCYWLGNEKDRRAVVVNPPPGVPAFFVQDGAIAVIMHVRCEGERIICFAGRQFSIIDIAWVDFGPLPNGTAISVTNQSRINLGGDIWISGDANAFLTADDLSQITVGTNVPIVITRPVEITYFALSYKKALIELLNGAHFVNPQFVRGQQYIALWDGAIHTGGAVIPGTIAGAASVPGHPGEEGRVWGIDTALQRELAQLQQQHAQLQQQLADLQQENARLNHDLREMLDSVSWRITAPLREVQRWIRSITRSTAAPSAECNLCELRSQSDCCQAHQTLAPRDIVALRHLAVPCIVVRAMDSVGQRPLLSQQREQAMPATINSDDTRARFCSVQVVLRRHL